MIKVVAVGTDGSGTAAKAVETAVEFAERFEAKLMILTAYRSGGGPDQREAQREAPDDVQWRNNPRSEAETVLREAGRQAEERGLEWASDSAEGDADRVLVDLAERSGADVLVVGNKGMGRRLLGSVPNSVSHAASCDVYIVSTT